MQGEPTGREMHGESGVTVPPTMNLADRCLDEHVRQGRGGRIPLTCDGREYSYRQLTELSARVSSGLKQLGLRPGQRVPIVLPDSAEFVATHFGAMRLGAVPVAANTLLTSQEYRYLLQDSRATALFVHRDYLEKMPRDSTPLKHVIVVGTDCTHPSLEGATAFEQLLAGGIQIVPPCSASATMRLSGSTRQVQPACGRT